MSSLPLPSFESKVCPLADLEARIAALPRPLVFTNGVFDILHRGHASYLAQAKELGASLVVGGQRCIGGVNGQSELQIRQGVFVGWADLGVFWQRGQSVQ